MKSLYVIIKNNQQWLVKRTIYHINEKSFRKIFSYDTEIQKNLTEKLSLFLLEIITSQLSFPCEENEKIAAFASAIIEEYRTMTLPDLLSIIKYCRRSFKDLTKENENHTLFIDNLFDLLEISISQQWHEKELYDYKNRHEELTEKKIYNMSLFQKILDQIELSVSIEDKNWNIIYVNPALEKITGYKKEELLGNNADLFKEKYDSYDYQAIMNTLKHANSWHGQIKTRSKDNVPYYLDVLVAPIIDSKGTLTNFVTISRDITEKIRMEKHIRQFQNMEALGTLAGGIAHDFNNILAAIIINAELAMDYADSETENNLTQILLASNRARELINQILLFSHQGEEEVQAVNFSLIVKEFIKFLRASLPANIEIKENISSSDSKVMGDITLLHQLLANLCTNSYYAMKDKGGILEISLQDIEIKDTKHEDLFPGSYIELTVRDTGHGISEELKDRIFEPYFTTKKQGEGTGLGLSIIHRIIKNYGGEIKFQSLTGEGTAFFIYLPRVESLDLNKIELMENLKSGKEKILLVDDEKALIEALKSILERLGYSVFDTTSSQKALEIFKRFPDKFDLVITDQSMPGMRGDVLTGELLKINPSIPVIICTGFSDIINGSNFSSFGARDFIQKPVNRKILSEKIRQVLDRT